MANTRGIFTLTYVVEEKVPFDDWVALSDVWIAPSPFIAASPNTGYFGGGYTGNVRSEMDKVTYSTDTTAAVPEARLSVARYRLAATGNQTAGYFGGGDNGPDVATMEKVTYASDTTAALPFSANLSVARGYLAATGNQTAGYFGGGAFPYYSTMDKVTYSTDTTAAVPGANLSVGRYNLAASSSRNALPVPETVISSFPVIV